MKQMMITALMATTFVVGCTSKDVYRDVAQSKDPAKKYIVIQNIATERNRVYEKCDYEKEPNCSHKLVFETEIVAGKDEEGARTDLGVQYLEKWVKFYEDNDRHYPSWYDPSYPSVPGPGKGLIAWGKKSIRPSNAPNAEGRGNFGWYTANLTPTASGEWMHGTLGWGADGNDFIRKTHAGFLGPGWFKDIRSHGCSRHENRAIAYLQHILPAGTTVIKIYAKEALGDESLARYESQKEPLVWNWILTKDQVRKTNPYSSDASAVMARGVSQSDILEQGSYKVDRYPDVVKINTSKKGKSGKSGDAYKLDNFTGTFLIDEGRVVNYRHPSGLKVDGLETFKNPERPVPDYMIKK